MTIKKCTKCDTEKPYTDFNKDSLKSDGLRPECRKCQNKRESLYRKTKLGFIERMYAQQCARSKRRNHNLPSYTLKELTAWILNKDIFHILFDEWEKSNHNKDLSPSIDRIDDSIGYSFSNIRIVTWAENNTKGNYDRRNGNNNKASSNVIQMDFFCNIIAYHYSIASAARETGINRGSINKCCLVKQKQAGGFYWIKNISS